MCLIYKHTVESTPIGPITIIWTDNPQFQIEEIILSNPEKSSIEIAKEKYETEKILIQKESKDLKKFLKELNDYFNEKHYCFSLNILNLKKLKPFQRKVLIAEYNTKKGSVNTYGELAKKINHPKAYRAVGTALAKNPFPIAIPCHRTIKSDNTIGGFSGFQGGLESKKILLELEGIEIEGKKVVGDSPIISLDKNKQTKLI